MAPRFTEKDGEFLSLLRINPNTPTGTEIKIPRISIILILKIFFSPRESSRDAEFMKLIGAKIDKKWLGKINTNRVAIRICKVMLFSSFLLTIFVSFLAYVVYFMLVSPMNNTGAAMYTIIMTFAVVGILFYSVILPIILDICDNWKKLKKLSKREI